MSEWLERLLSHREQKDQLFRSGEGPLKGEALEQFAGLKYYPPDPGWAFQLPLVPLPADSAPEFALQTTTGTLRHMALLGLVSVPLPEGPQPLHVFGPLGETQPSRAFIPFKDATTGAETYTAGRYLEVPAQFATAGHAIVELDFNRAYHPYCAFSEGWNCPLPPAENRLSVPVRAGERL